MAEDHSKYMPHHPRPRFAAKGGKAPLRDSMLRARAEPTSHDGSGSVVADPNSYYAGQGGYDPGPTGPAPGNIPGMLPGSMG